MPRQSRIEISGCVYHIIARGINGEKIFIDDNDRASFLNRFEQVVKDGNGICYGWSLMPNHCHLIIRMGKKPVSWLMRKLLTGYAVYFNRRHKRRGYLFQNRYKSILCQEDAYLLELIRYVHLNPIRAKVVGGLRALEVNDWTGYKALMGKIEHSFQETDEVLMMFSGTKLQARERLKQFMEDGLGQGKRDDLTGGGLRRSAGGWENVKQLQAKKEYWRGDSRILGDGTFVEKMLVEAEQEFKRKEKIRRAGIDINRLKHLVCNEFAIRGSDLRMKGRANVTAKAKAVFAYYANCELGINYREIAEELRCSPPAITRLIRKGEEIVVADGIKLINQDRPLKANRHP